MQLMIYFRIVRGMLKAFGTLQAMWLQGSPTRRPLLLRQLLREIVDCKERGGGWKRENGTGLSYLQQ